MTPAEIVDAAATAPVLVFGSPPPEGRDLDVITRARPEVEAALRDAGFITRGPYEWARFAGGTAEGVDLDDHHPHFGELLADAVAIDGFERLVRPSPAHQLLLLATMLRDQGRYPAKRVARMRAAVAEDPRAAASARARAADWGVSDELERVLAGKPVERRKARRPRVVGLSGIDGSGKSTQAKALARALEQLGYDVEIAWAPLGSSRLLRAIFLPIRNALGRHRAFQAEAKEETGLPPTAGTVLRERSRLAHLAWSTLIAASNGAFHARTVARASAYGRVVIFDRYVLDSRVRLRFLYGRHRGYALQDILVRLLSPKPRAAFLLDVSAEDSLARKDDRWSSGDLRTLTELYGELNDGSVTRLDGRRPAEELSAEIASAVWQRLG